MSEAISLALRHHGAFEIFAAVAMAGWVISAAVYAFWPLDVAAFAPVQAAAPEETPTDAP